MGRSTLQVWQSHLVLSQLQYTGMLDSLAIRKEGYPARPLHAEFYERYRPLFVVAAREESDELQQENAAATQLTQQETLLNRARIALSNVQQSFQNTQRRLAADPDKAQIKTLRTKLEKCYCDVEEKKRQEGVLTSECGRALAAWLRESSRLTDQARVG